MQIRFVPRTGGPDGLVCEAELVFDEGALKGMKLVGISIWRGDDDDLRVTFPSHVYFAYLRPDAGDVVDVRAVKQWILGEFEE